MTIAVEYAGGTVAITMTVAEADLLETAVSLGHASVMVGMSKFTPAGHIDMLQVAMVFLDACAAADPRRRGRTPRKDKAVRS